MKQKRVQGQPASCFKCPKISDDSPRNQRNQKDFVFATEVTDRTKQALNHYEECEAVNWVGCEVDDIVRRNAGIIKRVKDEDSRFKMERLHALLEGVAMRPGW